MIPHPLLEAILAQRQPTAGPGNFGGLRRRLPMQQPAPQAPPPGPLMPEEGAPDYMVGIDGPFGSAGFNHPVADVPMPDMGIDEDLLAAALAGVRRGPMMGRPPRPSFGITPNLPPGGGFGR